MNDVPRLRILGLAEQSNHPRALEARYVFDTDDLDNLAEELGWRRAAVPVFEMEGNART